MHTLHVIYHKEIPPTIRKDPIDDLLREKDKRNIYIQKDHFPLCLIVLQRNPSLVFVNVGFVRLAHATTNLTTVCKALKLTHPRTEISKFGTYSKYTVNIKKF